MKRKRWWWGTLPPGGSGTAPPPPYELRPMAGGDGDGENRLRLRLRLRLRQRQRQRQRRRLQTWVRYSIVQGGWLVPANDGVFPFQQLDVYQGARALAVAVKEASIRHPELQDQAMRASISAFLTLAEGLPNKGAGMRRKYFTESNNSLHETIAAVDLASALGLLDPPQAARIQELGLRFRKMLYALRA